MSRIDSALALARQGLLIFPLRPRVKTPYKGDEWKLMMTSDEATIRQWFADRPDMNYAVCGGSKFLVLDLDCDAAQDKDGIKVLADLEETQDPSDWVTEATFEVKSPRGGRHLYLSAPQAVGCSIGTFAPGIDIRGGLTGSEGYVVGPGSHTDADPSRNTAAGEYVIIGDRPIAEAPPWIMARVATTNLQRAEGVDDAIVEWDLPRQIDKGRAIIMQQTSWPTEGQGGDAATYHFCALMRDQAITPETAFELLQEPLYEDGKSWNESCDPPWDASELWTKVNNAYRYARNQPGSKGSVLEEEEAYGCDFAELAEKAERLKQYGKLQEMTFRGDALTLRDVQHEMIVPDWLPAYGMTQVLAKRSTGKTIIVLDLVLRIACGDMDWHGMPIAPDWAVVYLCGEDDLGLQQQMKAWKKKHGRLPAPENFIVMTGVPDLMSAEDVKMWSAYLNEVIGDRRVLTVVDTWGRAASRASQNDDEQMQTAMAHAEALARDLRGPCIALYHPPKHSPNTISGSSVIENNGTAIWGVVKEQDNFTRRIEVLRLKNGVEGKYKLFSWSKVDLDETDQFGQQRSGIVPTQTGGTGVAVPKEVLENNKTARGYYATVIAECLVAYHNNVSGKKLQTDLSMSNMVGMVMKFLHDEKNDIWRKRLQSVQQFTWANKASGAQGLEKVLRTMFRDDPSPQDTLGHPPIVCVKQSAKLTIFQFVDMTDDKPIMDEMEELKNVL